MHDKVDFGAFCGVDTVLSRESVENVLFADSCFQIIPVDFEAPQVRRVGHYIEDSLSDGDESFAFGRNWQANTAETEGAYGFPRPILSQELIGVTEIQ